MIGEEAFNKVMWELLENVEKVVEGQSEKK